MKPETFQAHHAAPTVVYDPRFTARSAIAVRRASDHYLASLLRVAAVQLPRLDPEDRAVLRPYVERDMAAHQMTDQVT